jgi:hypothetical protein
MFVANTDLDFMKSRIQDVTACSFQEYDDYDDVDDGGGSNELYHVYVT